MSDTKEKIRRLRHEVIRTFLLLFVPHIIVCLFTTAVTNNPMHTMKFQLIWFSVYFGISLCVYIFAPKLVKK